VKIGYRGARRTVAAGLALTIYVALSHYASSVAIQDGRRFAAGALLFYLVVALVFAWRSRHQYGWALLCVALGALAWRHLDAIGDHMAWFYFVQHVGVNAALAVAFGSTLARGRTPLCTRIASFVHDPLAPELARYTRQVTLAWTIFFVANVAVSAMLFAFAPVVIWSTFANILDLPLVALMFVIEYAVRRHVLPDLEHVSIFESVRRYVQLGRASPPPAA
jgi:uncharacterized membrane protein